MTTTLVTGATGFIGGCIARAALERGDHVRALVRDPARAGALADGGLELVSGDVTKPASLREAVRGVGRVYHCAALVGDWFKKPEITRVNVDGTRNLLQACAAEGVGRLIYLSSLSVLGAKHHHGTDESAPYQPTGEVYSDAKIDSERLVRGFADRGEVETVILRPGFVYGPGDNQFLPRLVESLRAGQFAYVGDGSKLLNIVYVSDVAEAALLAANSPQAVREAYNLTDGTRTSLREFVTFVCKELGLPPPTRRLPPALAWTLTYLLEGIARAGRSGKAPRLNRGRMRFLYYNQFYSIEKARSELGFTPRFSYREGLPVALEGLRDTAGAGDERPEAAEAG